VKNEAADTKKTPEQLLYELFQGMIAAGAIELKSGVELLPAGMRNDTGRALPRGGPGTTGRIATSGPHHQLDRNFEERLGHTAEDKKR
jgi:hypothetical protein